MSGTVSLNPENFVENCTALSYKSHIKMLIKEFTGNEFDISDKVQFPNFNVSTYVK